MFTEELKGGVSRELTVYYLLVVLLTFVLLHAPLFYYLTVHLIRQEDFLFPDKNILHCTENRIT
jgi:hypothetical protein